MSERAVDSTWFIGDLQRAILAILPDADFGEDELGQLIVHTGQYQGVNGLFEYEEIEDEDEDTEERDDTPYLTEDYDFHNELAEQEYAEFEATYYEGE